MNENRQVDTSPSPLLLVADDYAFTAGISRAILDLIAKDRLSATSVMTTSPVWADFGPALAQLREKSDAGLHLNLTCGAPLGPLPCLAPTGSFGPVSAVIRRSLSGSIDQMAISAEIIRQIDAFERYYGQLPLYIDGHQHVHALPGIRGALFRAIGHYCPDYCPFLRDPGDTLGRILARGVAVPKALTIAALSVGFGAAARARGFETNDGFAGISAFNPDREFRSDFIRFLRAPGPRHLVMVHPGEADDPDLARLDPVIATRPLEWHYLRGPEFLDDLTREGLRLARISDQSGYCVPRRA
jgi:predicted glycoside hydrolase/deacetylase ChbG (UPF0249 family)